MMIDSPSKRFAFWCALLLLVVLAVNGLMVVGQFIGYAVTAEGGTISELIIQHNVPTQSWAAVYGVAVRVQGYNNPQYSDILAGDMDERNLLFDCLQRDIVHEVYATTGDPFIMDLSSLTPLDPGELDVIEGVDPTEYDSATNTYTQMVTFEYGLTEITAPGTITYAIGEDPPATYSIALTQNPDGIPVFVAVLSNFTRGFNNRTFNYQMLLPASNISRRYNLFPDPNDVCGEGEGDSDPTGVVFGYVTTTTGLPIPGVIIEVAGSVNVTDASGYYRLEAPFGNKNIYGIKTGFRIYQNNLTVVAFNETQHDIVLIADQPPNQNTGIGPGIDEEGTGDATPVTETGTGVGPGQDVGPGEAPLVPIVQQPKVIEGADYIISLTELNRRLRLGQFLQDKIYVYSFKKAPARVTVRVNGTGIEDLIEFDNEELLVEPNGKGEFVLTIFGNPPVGLFNGTIELEGDLNATIPVLIEVLPQDKIPVESLQIELDTAKKSYFPGDVVRAQTDLRNMLIDRQYPVRLFYTLQSVDGEETIWTSESYVFVQTAFSLIKNFKIPANVASGDYILRVTANYLDLSSGTSTIFHIAVPFWQRSLLGIKFWIWFLILLFIGASVGAFFYIRQQIEARKKFHIKVDYNELPKPGPRSILVGKIAETDHTTYFNLEKFKVHTIVAGSTGGGKSVSAQVIIEEALDKGVAVIAFDPTAQWTGMLRPCKDKMMLSLYPLYGMKPNMAKAYPGNIRQINDAREKIDIKKYVKPGEIQVFAGHKLDPKDMDIVVANAIREIFHANFPEEKLLKVMFVFDEVHRLLPKFGGSGDGFLQIERGCREFRKWGLGILLISQVLSDFMGTIKANINTEIQMRTRDEGDLERIRQKYGEDVLRSLVKATVGSGMVENPAYNLGKPYFIAFRPLKHSTERLSDEEIEQYNTYNDMIDDLFFSLEQLEELKVDVFDLKLELKLAQDKVKTGNFNMVKIYIEGLKPRIEKHWQKLGKEPKKLVRELVDMSEIQAELKKAAAERDEYTKKEGGGDGDKKEEKKGYDWKDDVPPDKLLNLKNGMIINNLASMYDEVTAMKDADLPNEFDPEPKPPEEGAPTPEPKNNFAYWVYTALGETKLANHMAAAKTKEELVAALELKRDKKDIPDTKPPEWFDKLTKKDQEKAAFNELSQEPPAVAPAAAAPAPAAPAPAAPVEGQPAAPVEGQPAVAPAQPVAAPVEGQPAAPVAAAPAPAAPVEGQPAQPAQPAVAQPAPAPAPVEGQPAAPVAAAPAPAAPVEGQPAAAPAPAAPVEGQPAAAPAAAPPVEGQPAQPAVAQPAPAPAEAQPAQPPGPVEAAKTGGSLDTLMVQDESQAFRLENGVAIKGIKELREYIPQMDDGLFNSHVGQDYNHFADWIRGVFNNEELANKVAGAHSKDEMVAVLNG
jgi:hypothetical protein